MNIAIFTDSYKPYTSGVVRSIELFSKEFLKKGNKVYVFGPDYPLYKTKIRHEKHEEGVFRFFSIPSPTYSDFVIPIPISLQLKNTILKIKADVIHVHSPFLMGGLGARIAKKLLIPLIFTHHTMYDQYVHYFPFVRDVSRKMVQNISRDFCNKCNLVITPSYPVKQYIHQLGVRTPVKVIPTGIELEEFAETDSTWLRKTYNISNDEKILLFVGRLGKEKNLSFLIRVFRQILKTIPHSRLVIIGSGPLESYLKKMCQDLGITEKVVFTGLMPRHKIVHCYAGADLFVFPSVTETQGLVIGEAKAAGIPVVAVRAFGTADMVIDGEDGYLTDLSMINFKKRIIELLTDDDLHQRMKIKAQHNAHYLSSSYCADLMLQAYEELIIR